MASRLHMRNMSLASQKKLNDDGDHHGHDLDHCPESKMTTFSFPAGGDDDKSIHTRGSVRTNTSASMAGMSSTACMSCESSLDPMFDDENLNNFDVLLYPPHNPFSDPEDQLLQFASETHPVRSSSFGEFIAWKYYYAMPSDFFLRNL